MSNQENDADQIKKWQSEDEKADRYLITIPALLFLIFFGSIFLAQLTRIDRAKDCDGKPGSPVSNEVTGIVTSFNGSYYIPNQKKGGNWILFTCGGKCSSPLKNTFHKAIGKEAKASFCSNEVLWVEIEGNRVLTRDLSGNLIWFSIFIVFGSIAIVVGVAWFSKSRDQQSVRRRLGYKN